MVFDGLRRAVTGEVPNEPIVHTVHDQRFGAFTVTGQWHPRVVTVQGPGPATLAMTEELSSRAAALFQPPQVLAAVRNGVRLLVDGVPTEFDPGRRALRRATFNVRVTVAGRRYLLRHRGRRRAHLERDGTVVAELAQPKDGRPWPAGYPAGADVVDATVGVTLGVTLGIGASGVLGNLVAGASP